ncbi:MAG: anthranilate phosphoribosyltransferase, partial [Flavobacteriaceae bacterium]|nr:anthranilate phosphoribosyltransferase [Flavobacteriaceae bacterium]
MKNILNRLIQHEVLSRQESKDILVGIANKAYNESEIA